MRKRGRYYIADHNGIPLRCQPENGYTYLQVIARVQRELDECVKLFGGKPQDHKDGFMVLDSKFHEVKEAKDAF